MALDLFKKNVASFDPNNLVGSDRDNSITVPTYIKGYSSYLEKHGGPDEFLNRVKKHETGFSETSGAVPNLEGGMFDNPSNQFKKALYGYNSNNTDDYEDPTFLIFDIKLIKNESPLFTSNDYGLRNFITNYYSYIPELNERFQQNIYEEFLNILFKIFPSESHSDSSGLKRHYIESISGLDIVNKKIINYPEDKITFILSEDITLISHYLAELYNNLIFSYDTQRCLIPENLLRFNFQITIKDIRNFKTPRLQFESEINTTTGNNEIDTSSKIIYTFHDCQFNFFETKSITDNMTVNGWGTPIVSTPAKNTFTINFKSISKAIAPYLIKNGKIIDFRERNDLATNDFTITEPPINNTRERTSRNSRFQKFVSNKISNTKKLLQNETSEIRAVLINKLSNEVGQFIGDIQNTSGERFGITLTKINVYYDTIADKIDNASGFINDFLDDKIFDRNRTPEINASHGLGSDINSGSDNVTYNKKYPDGDLQTDGTYNEKYPTDRNRYLSSVLNADGSFQQDLTSDGIGGGPPYVSEYPTDLHADGQYNQKFPDGDLQDDGQYNLKFPDGDLQADGTYNLKLPDGDVQSDGQYNLKYPIGDLQADGQYNTKFPNGDVQSDGQYNKKYPKGKLYTKGIDIEKQPKGDVQTDGQYNKKYPNGDLQEPGNYNEKIPNGDVYKVKEEDTEKATDKKPTGSLYGNKNDNDKQPTGNIYKKK